MDPRRSGGVPTMRDIALARRRVAEHRVPRPQRRRRRACRSPPRRASACTLAARELGYRPNPLARGLRGAPTMLLGAVVRDITDPFFAGAIEALSRRGHGRAATTWCWATPTAEPTRRIALTAVLETRHCDAIVLLGDMQDQPRLLDRPARPRSSRSSALWQGSSPLDVPDRRRRQRGRHPGRARAPRRPRATSGIAFVSGRPLGDIRERQAAFIEFMGERFGGVPDGYIRQVPNTPTGGETARRATCSGSTTRRPRS